MERDEETASKEAFLVFSFQRTDGQTDRIEINRRARRTGSRRRVSAPRRAHTLVCERERGRAGAGVGEKGRYPFRGTKNRERREPAGRLRRPPDSERCIARCFSRAKYSTSTTSIRSLMRPSIRMLTRPITPSARPCRSSTSSPQCIGFFGRLTG